MNEHSFRKGNGLVRPREGDKRRRIIDAAVHVFSERGFFNSRVNDVAEAAGVAGGTIYLYFKNKDDLLISVFEDRMDTILAMLKSELREEQTPPGQLRRFIELHLELVQRDQALADVLAVELRQSAKFVREYRARKFYEYLGVAEDILTDGMRDGSFRADIDPKLYRRALFGALDELTVMWLACAREGRAAPWSLNDAVNQVFNLFVSGLGPEAEH
ncbi:MAG: TetR/AcrR family transcriptional regulator [Myxococcota bacterium]|nr:TetR/AcrR family transcriptional regulator [Myxococcota bacterium]